MKKSIYLQIFIFAIIVALMGSFNNYGQDSRSKFIRLDNQNKISGDILPNFKLDSEVPTNFTPNSVQAILYDQTAGTTTAGIASQDFETANDAYDCQAADNFTVPAGGWSINQVVIGGFYTVPGGPAAGFNVYFYPDAGGVPGAAPVYTALSQPYSFDATYFTISLGTAAVLTPGNYWLSVQSRMDFSTGGQSYWRTVTGAYGSVAQWQNPGNGFAACQTWGPITTCNTSVNTDMSFALVDAPPVTAVPLPVIEDFESGIFPPLNWTQSGVIWTNDNTISGYGNGTWSAVADFYSVETGSDDLITVEYISTGASNPTLTFDWAYATYDATTIDEMDIYYSTDAGATWTILLAMPGGINGILNPFHLVRSAAYFPADNEWSTMSLALPANTNKVKFTAVTAYGNLCWLDNIQIGDTFFDDMDAYTAGGQLACQSTPVWTTWSIAPCDPVEDPYISTNYAYSGVNSCVLVADNDLVKQFGGKTSGVWYVNFRFYIPAGKSGYVNLLSDFTSPYEWGLDCYFYDDGTGELELDLLGSYFFNYQQANWNNVLFIVDLNTGTAEFWVGKNAMTQIATWDWTRGGTLANTLGANDFYGYQPTNEWYFDDYYFSDAAPPIQQAADDAGTVSIDIASQVAPVTFMPQATVKNYGTETNTFNVLMTINPGGYSSTQPVTALAGGATQQVTFANWTGTIGAYTVTVTTQLSGDEDLTNDSQTQSLYVWDPDGTWSTGANYPQGVYLGSGQGYSNGSTNYLFSIAGITASALETECYKFDVNTNTWSPVASLPADRDRHATALSGNFLYQIGGYNIADAIQSTAFKYDIAGNSWSAIASLPVAIGWNKAVAYGNYIYHAGGYDGTNILADVYVYNITTNTWSAATPMPGERFGGAFSIVGNQLIYVGGASNGPISDAVFVGTITAPGVISWVTAKNPFPGTQKITYGINSDLTKRMLSSTSVTKGMLAEAVPYPAGSMYRFDAAPWGSDGIIVAGGSPSSEWAAANPNPCYIYKPTTDVWIAKENVLDPVTAASSGSVFNGSTWKLIMTGGIDADGFLVDTTQIFTQTLGATTFALSVNVTLGWNMVSAPGLHPVNQNVATWWTHRTGTVWGFNGSQYVARTVTTPGEGYWMKNTLAETYNYPAITIVPHNPIPATLGWNMLGGYETSPTIVALKAANPQITGTVWGFNGSQYVSATNLVPGYSYWVKTTAAGNITIPDALAKGNEVVELFKEDWGRIILTDAAGLSYTLYAVKGEVDLSQYEMPPMPPSGSFDIRFSSGRIAEDINSSIQTIDMVGITYPLTVRVEGMDIRLMDETGKALNQNLKSGEDMVISDATIQKLMVSGESIPTVYALEQNYPNPFNPSTVIEFSLPEDVGNVKLSIYNALGEKVAELVNTSLTAGKYSYQWNASSVATGMYIYELRTDKFVSVKKMLLLK